VVGAGEEGGWVEHRRVGRDVEEGEWRRHGRRVWAVARVDGGGG
jgi:hypothetical protein